MGDAVKGWRITLNRLTNAAEHKTVLNTFSMKQCQNIFTDTDSVIKRKINTPAATVFLPILL